MVRGHAAFLLSLVAVVACSNAASSATSEEENRPDGGAGPGPTSDSSAPAPANEAGAGDAAPSAVDLACLGESRPLVFDGGLPFATVKVGVGAAAASGAFLVDLATTSSTIDIAAFPAGFSANASNCDPTRLGQRCSFADFDFFGSWGMVTLRTDDHDLPGAPVREAGILGTDFLSVVTITLDYAASKIHRAKNGTLCSDAALEAAGFEALSSSGFYAADTSSLRPMRDVDSTAPAGVTVANVPTVPMKIAGQVAQTQLDTGFGDSLVPYSVNVNEALLAAMPAGSLVRAPSRDLSLTTCAGVAETVEAYELAPGKTVELGSHAFTSAVIFVKRTPPAARVCGGIGTWTIPAAQIGASFYRAVGATVFDPYSSRVWIR